jgi:hypothetical protein
MAKPGHHPQGGGFFSKIVTEEDKERVSEAFNDDENDGG